MGEHRGVLMGLGTIFSASVAVLLLTGMSNNPGAARATARLDWGVYRILHSRRYGEHLTRELAKFATKPAYVMFYRDLGRPFPKGPDEAVHAHGATTIVSLELWSWHGTRGTNYLEKINAGDYDAFFRQWATDAKSTGRRVLLRFGFEFNGNWFTWFGDPKGYAKAWRRAHGIFQAVGATNVEWIWAPNIQSCPDTPENNMHAYFPGDTYVDWIGVDGYNFGDHHDVWHKWQSFEKIYDAILKDFAARYPHKPVMISEFGCAPGKPGQREQWIREAYESLLKRPQVKAAVWFDLDKRRENEPNWRIDATPGSLKAFNETFASPTRSDR